MLDRRQSQIRNGAATSGCGNSRGAVQAIQHREQFPRGARAPGGMLESARVRAMKRLLDMQPVMYLRRTLDVDALAQDVRFRPSPSIEDGVKRFVEWYREFYDVPPRPSDPAGRRSQASFHVNGGPVARWETPQLGDIHGWRDPRRRWTTSPLRQRNGWSEQIRKAAGRSKNSLRHCEEGGSLTKCDANGPKEVRR